MSPRQFFGCCPTPLLPYLLMVAIILFSSEIFCCAHHRPFNLDDTGRKVLSSAFFCARFLQLIHASFPFAESSVEYLLVQGEYPCCHATTFPRYHCRPPPANEISWYSASHESQSYLLYPVWVSTIKFIEL